MLRKDPAEKEEVRETSKKKRQKGAVFMFSQLELELINRELYLIATRQDKKENTKYMLPCW